MPKAPAYRYDLKSFMELQPFTRNILFFLYSIIALIPISYLSYRIIQALFHLNRVDEKRAFFTQLIVAVLFTLLCVMSPIFALRRLYRYHIHYAGEHKGFWSLFRLRNPWDPMFCDSAKQIATVVDHALRSSDGDVVSWDLVPLVSQRDLNYAKLLVQETLIVKSRNEDGSSYVVESSAWLLVFSHLVLIIAVLLAGNFSVEEVRKNGIVDDAQIGKVLSEWMSNYVLLIIGFLQIVTRGAWFQGFAGICQGASSTMSYNQRNAVVALYIASAESEIKGLRKQSSYARTEMTGTRWVSPPTSTLVLASMGRSFKVFPFEGEYRVDWTCADADCEVRTVGRAHC